jgi:hypothetical protein
MPLFSFIDTDVFDAAADINIDAMPVSMLLAAFAAALPPRFRHFRFRFRRFFAMPSRH